MKRFMKPVASSFPFLLTVVGFAAALGCTGTRVGNPNAPDGAMPIEFESLNLDRTKVEAFESVEGVRIEGMPGAAPPEAEVRAASLDEASGYERASVEEDGSFSIMLLSGGVADFFVQAFTAKGFSQAVFVSTIFRPTNLVCVGAPPLELANRVAPGTVVALDFVNGCPLEESVEVALHPLSKGVSLATEMNVVVPANGSLSILLDVTAASGQTFEGVVVVRSDDQFFTGTVVGSVE